MGLKWEFALWVQMPTDTRGGQWACKYSYLLRPGVPVAMYRPEEAGGHVSSASWRGQVGKWACEYRDIESPERFLGM